MRILFATPYVPSLMRVRPFNLITQLSRRHSVTLVCLTQGDRARRFVQNAYSWEAAVRGLEEVYAQAAEIPRHRLAAAAWC